MSKDFEKIRSCVEVENYIQLREPEFIEKYIKRELARNIADYILKEIENLPITMTTTENIEEDSKTYTIDLNLISKEHYKHLKEQADIGKIYKESLNRMWRLAPND